MKDTPIEERSERDPVTNHSPEPWRVEKSRDIGDWDIACDLGIVDEHHKANAQRIVACVNAMAGIDYPAQTIYQAWYQLNQVRKEFEKFGTLGEHRIQMVKETLNLFPPHEGESGKDLTDGGEG